MTKQFLRLLVVLGIGVNVAFLLINLRPDTPHLGKRRKVKLLLRMDDARKKWLTENVLSEFAATNDVDFEVQTAKSFDEVEGILKKEKEKPSGLALTAIDDARTGQLVAEGLVQPMESLADPANLKKQMDDYLPEALAQGKDAAGKVWFLPRRAQLDIALFMRPAVEDAYLNWEKDRKEIEAALAAVNGVGLPKGYALKSSPDNWDLYDLFVCAWYWAHHPAPWVTSGRPPANGPSDGGTPPPQLPAISPRLALRSGHNENAIHDLIGAFYRNGFVEAQLGQVDLPPVIDALQWQALFRRHKLVVEHNAADPEALRNLFRERQIAWAAMNQEDSFWLHGGADRDAARGMRGSRDLGWTSRPAGASLELKDGKPARKGKSFSFLQVELFAVPVHAPNPKLSYRVARFMTRSATHLRETEAQGLLPIRKDLQRDYSILIRLEWMQRILEASYRQVRKGSGHLPDPVLGQGIGDQYEDVLEHVVSTFSSENVPIRYETVREKALEVKSAR